MGWQLLGALPAAVALVALTTNVGHADELRGATWEAEGDPRKGDVASFRLSRATQRSKPTFYRTGSLSALSRGLMTNLSILQELQKEEGGALQHKREASPARDACWGCCGAPFPNHTEGSREPAREDSGHLGSTPPPKPPKRNPTKGSPRPGAYTPMGKLRQGSLMPAEGRQNESFPGMNSHGHQEAQATGRCRGCCGPNGTAAGRPQGRGEEGRGSQSSQGSSSKRPWRPVLDREVPANRPLQKGENGWPSFPGGNKEPWQPQKATWEKPPKTT